MELLDNTEMGILVPYDSFDTSKDFVDIEGVSEGVVRSDYFAFDSEKRYAKTIIGDTIQSEGSVSSDNPSWIEPCLESTRFVDDDKRIEFRRKNSSEFWSDSSSDDSGSRKFIEFDGNEQVGIGDYVNREVGFDGIGENLDFGKFWSDSGGETSVEDKFGDDGKEMGNEPGSVDGENPEEMVKGEKKEMVWWKFPFEILKFCLFKVSPGWTISIAVAVMGIVILRRRLHKMKKKSQSIALKLTVDDKKVSQLMKRSARLNEVFSVVRNVPMIRPLLPAPGLTPWPIMNLR